MKVNIIGGGKGWELAPLTENSWGITLTNLNRKVDLVIDMNVYEDGRWGEQQRQLAIQSRALSVADNIPYIDLINYPLGEITDYFKIDYFTGTTDYAIALAIYRGYSSIGLYGANAAFGSDYYHQKPGIEYWLGQAMGRGIDVKVYGASTTILKAPGWQLYGYDTPQKYI